MNESGGRYGNGGGNSLRSWAGECRVGALAGLTTAALLVITPAHAELKYDLGVDGDYEYNSNVYYLSPGYAVPGYPIDQKSDSLYKYGASGDVHELLSEQDVYVVGDVEEYRYNRFTALNHNEYNVTAGWNAKFGSDWDGLFEVNRDRQMVAFADLNQTTLSVQTDQRESARIRYKFAPEWRLGVSGYTHELQEPVVGAPQLELKESEVDSQLEFLGIANLTAGLKGGYVSGSYTGEQVGADFQAIVLNDASYHQTNELLTAAYQLSGKSTLSGQLGYSDRTSLAAANSVSGITGLLALNEAFTTKTTLNLSVNRIIQSYIANTGSEIDTIAHIGVTYQVTFKTGISIGYDYTYRDLPDQGFGDGTRIDHLQYTSLALTYQPRRWVTIKPYANYQTRTSDVSGYAFNTSIYGVKITLQTSGD